MSLVSREVTKRLKYRFDTRAEAVSKKGKMEKEGWECTCFPHKIKWVVMCEQTDLRKLEGETE